MNNPIDKIAQRLRPAPRPLSSTTAPMDAPYTPPSGWTTPRTGGVRWQGAATPSNDRAA